MSSGARSDNLGLLQQMSQGAGSPLLPYLSQIIIDANIAHQGLLWMAKKRKNPDAQTNIIEIAKTGFAEIHAPKFIKEEIRKYIPEIADKSNKSVEEVEALWGEYSTNIQFHDTSELPPLDQELAKRDPKDAPYLQLQQKLNHPIISTDKDIPAMGGKTVDIVAITRLRDLYRSNATEYQVAMVGYGVLAFGSLGIMALVSTLKAGISKFFNLPNWAYPLIIITLIIIFNNPRLKEKFGGWLTALSVLIPDLTEEIMEHTGKALNEFQNAQARGATLRQQLPDDFQPLK